jgi:hypothetical protein
MNMNSLKLLNMALTAPIFTKPIISQCHDVKIFYNEFRSNRQQKLGSTDRILKLCIPYIMTLSTNTRHQRMDT